MDWGSEGVPPPMLELRRVTVVRNGRAALREVSLRVEPGEHVAILGANGSGKSTLIKTITRELYPLFEPGCGLRLFGMASWRQVDLRRRMGLVATEAEAFQARVVPGLEAVVSGFFGSVGLARHLETSEAMWAKSRELMRWLGIEHLAERETVEMSSGELKRVMIARALVHGPEALLLDEPSNSLDVFAQRELRETMRRLAQAGLALLLITHHLSDVVPEIERVIFLREGRIVADGPKEALLTEARLSELFGCAVRVSREDGYYHLIS